jgi:ferritin-like protein
MREHHKGDVSGEIALRSSESFGFRRGRRAFMFHLLASGSRAALATTAAAAVFGLGTRTARAAASDTDIGNFGNAAVGAERVGIAFYSNALGVSSPFANQPTDLAKGTLLNNAHRVYFQAALNQETQHLTTLLSFNLSFPFSKFGFPAGTFDSAPSMLAFGERLESVFIGAYLGAVRVSAGVADSLGVTVAELAAQIVGVECEHRVLIRDIAGENPPNDRFFEGDQAPGQGTQLGNTGERSTVYSSGDAAVDALLALGIFPIP